MLIKSSLNAFLVEIVTVKSLVETLAVVPSAAPDNDDDDDDDNDDTDDADDTDDDDDESLGVFISWRACSVAGFSHVKVREKPAWIDDFTKVVVALVAPFRPSPPQYSHCGRYDCVEFVSLADVLLAFATVASSASSTSVRVVVVGGGGDVLVVSIGLKNTLPLRISTRLPAGSGVTVTEETSDVGTYIFLRSALLCDKTDANVATLNISPSGSVKTKVSLAVGDLDTSFESNIE